MKKLKLRMDVLRELDRTRLSKAAGGVVLTGTETMYCPTLPVKQCRTLQGCTTAVDCP